jgi:Domain of unknown function (DUF4390)
MRPARRILPGLVLVLLALAPGTRTLAGQVAEARIYLDDGWVRLDLSARDLLDERTTLTIDSGLPGTCVYRLRIENRQHETVVEHYLEQTLRLDLWENIYFLQYRGAERSFESLADADDAWSHLQRYPLIRESGLRPEQSYRLIIQVAVRPLAAEDRERMSRYVQRHSGSGSEELSLDLGALLAGMFGHKGGDEKVARHEGLWFGITDLEVQP